MRHETVLMFSVTLALVLVGVVMVYSTGTVAMYDGDPLLGIDRTAFLRQHLIYVALGMVALCVAARVDYHLLRSSAVLVGIVGLSLALLVAVLALGDETKGAARWIRFAGFSFQPSELAKLAIIVWLAARLSGNREHAGEFFQGFVPPMVVTGVFAILVLAERDLGTPMIIGTVALLMCAMAGARWRYISATAAMGIAGVYVLCRTSEYRWARIIAYLDPLKYRETFGHHLLQSLGAFARGGIWGQGLGASEQKLFYLPEADNDFIFAVWGEEMGLAGTVALVVLFAGFLIVALRVALCAPDLLGSLLAGGIASLISLQAFFHMAVTTGMVPTKGLPLPFISAGGSAILVNLTLVGILLNISAQGREPEAQPVYSKAT